MSFLAEDVNKIAWLARIQIDEKDTDEYAKDLSGILDLVDQMAAVDTSNVQPMAHPLDQTQRLRSDVVSEIDQRDYFQSQAPRIAEGLYLVPKVIEQI